MHIDFAQLSIVVAMLLGVISASMLPLTYFSKKQITKLLKLIIFVQFSLISFAFFSLEYSYITSDFSVENVYKNSHHAVPLLYKITGLWSNHEGSMLLWVFLLSLCNFIFTFHKIDYEEKLWIYFIQILITSSVLSYIIFKSNPFIKLMPVPKQGIGFNPLLQDMGLAIHPPILYVGYVSTSIPFVMACAAMIRKKLTRSLIEIMQAWNLLSWSFLTLGISLGAWWAYRELGWGGYWFWDPVENASLMPWLSSIALIHSIYSTKKLNTNYASTFVLAICGFLLAILTSFFVRSGAVTSVHSFAQDASRGLYILAILFIYSFFALLLFANRIKYFESSNGYSWVSRLGGINISNILWSICIIIIVLSLIYPLFIQNISGSQITVESSFFKQNFVPLTGVILLLLAATLPATWQNILKIHNRHLIYSLIVSIIITGIFCKFYCLASELTYIFIFFTGVLVVSRMIFWIYIRDKISIKFLFIWIVHIVAGLFAISIAYLETNSQELVAQINENQAIEFAGFKVTLIKKENYAKDNYLSGKIILNVFKENEEVGNLTPEIRYYPVENTQTAESSILHNIFYDLYAVISEIDVSSQVTVKLYYKPLINWLWAISLITFICGLVLLYLNHRKRNNASS